MGFLLPILILPIAIFICAFLNIQTDLSKRATEQVRLDTFTLALCHDRQKFIVETIEGTNTKIIFIQNRMDEIALACAAGGELVPGFCATVVALLQGLSASGKALMIYQQTQRAIYLTKFSGFRRRLAGENSLTSQNGILREISNSISLLEDGFEIEETSEKRKTWESIYGASWPKRLKRDKYFYSVHHFEFEFYPKRQLAGVSPKDYQNWRGLDVFEHQTNQRGFSRSLSSCRIDSNYNVRRLQK
ncbi:MAG: hypothetical protein J0L93_01660 [Deltaproteobacteria bacterium]|nr:hypothetical protein [Deltaproteobacteria bacterium]